MYDDRLSIWNPGELPAGWSVKKLLKQHSSRPYNPSVANTFFRTGEIEAWGRGIQRIFAACQESATPVPRINYEPGDLWFEFPFSPDYLKIISVGDREAKLVERVGEKLDEKLDEKLGATRAAIIRLMRDNPKVTVIQIAEQLGMSRTAIDKNIQILKAQGYAERIGPAKGGHWQVVD